MATFILSGQTIDIYEGDGLDPFARTGATSIEQLVRAGATGVILGHSEVGDSPEIVHRKLGTIANKDVLPFTTVLVGESWEEYEGKSSEAVAKTVSAHLVEILADIPKTLVEKLVIGYEPKWGSRGSGRDDMPPPQPETISVVCHTLRHILGNTTTPVIYGGRSTPERTEEILKDENVEGLILGSACKSVEKTMGIVQSMLKVRESKRKIVHANFKAYNLADSYETYVQALHELDDTFVVYLSPPDTDIRTVKALL